MSSIKICAISLFLLALTGVAFANNLGPTGSGAPDLLTSGGTAVADTGTVPWSESAGPSMSGFSETRVYSDPSNVFCNGCLDFIFIISNSPASTVGESIQRITDSTFAGYATDVGIATNFLCTLGPNVAPTSVDRSSGAGSTVGWNFSIGGGVAPGQCSDVLEIETNALSFTSGTLFFIDGFVATVASYAPSGPAVPEPASLTLLGTGLLALGGGLRKKLFS